MTSTKRKATSERQLEIVQAAREILVSEGFHKLTLRSVANKVGIKLASLQYHFSNRAALIQALIGQASDYYQSRASELLELDFGVEPQQKLEQALRSMLDDHKSQEENQFFFQMMAMTVEEPAAQELIDDFYQRLWTIGSDLLLELNPSLDEDERLNRSAHIVSLVEGCVFIIGSPRLRGKLPDSYYDHIINWVKKIVFEQLV